MTQLTFQDLPPQRVIITRNQWAPVWGIADLHHRAVDRPHWPMHWPDPHQAAAAARAEGLAIEWIEAFTSHADHRHTPGVLPSL